MSHQCKHANKPNTCSHSICICSYLQFCHRTSPDQMLLSFSFLWMLFFPFGSPLPLANNLFPPADVATGRSLSHAFCPVMVHDSCPGQAQRVPPSLPLKSHLPVCKWGWQREGGRVAVVVDSVFFLLPHVFERQNQPPNCFSLIIPHLKLTASTSYAVSSSSVLWWCVSATFSRLPFPVPPTSGVFCILILHSHLCLWHQSPEST